MARGYRTGLGGHDQPVDLPLLESVPNVSVGRDPEVVDAIVLAATQGAARGGQEDGSRAAVVDVHRDTDHDRSVVTLIGSGAALESALAQLARATVELVDVHAGHGVHPRVGALDVVPVISLDATERGAAAAHLLARRISAFVGALGVPVVRYGLEPGGGLVPGAGSTGMVRRGGPAAVLERISSGELELAAGPTVAHPRAGATICGVRDVLVAFNVDLDVDDLDVARGIAARIRASSSSSSLPGVRALGLRLSSRRVAQVSTNVEEYRITGPARVLEQVAGMAAEAGVGVSAAELVGLAPDAALGPLRYACIRHGVPLLAAAEPSLQAAMRSARAR